jgi:hypothetical protein
MIEDTLNKAREEDNGLANEIGVELRHPQLNSEEYYLNVAIYS